MLVIRKGKYMFVITKGKKGWHQFLHAIELAKNIKDGV